jgi:hypothetical protein
MKKNHKVPVSLYFLFALALGIGLYAKIRIDDRVFNHLNWMSEELAKANMPPAQIQGIRSGLSLIASDIEGYLGLSIFAVTVIMFLGINIVFKSKSEG